MKVWIVQHQRTQFEDRTIDGVFASEEVAEAFRFNHRKDADGKPLSDFARFDVAVRQIVGKRLTFDQLTGKEMNAPA